MLLLAGAFLRRNNIISETVFSPPLLNAVFLILFRLGLLHQAALVVCCAEIDTRSAALRDAGALRSRIAQVL